MRKECPLYQDTDECPIAHGIEYCQSCRKETQQETARKIFKDIEKLIIKDHFGNDVIYINVIQWQELKSKYGVE